MLDVERSMLVGHYAAGFLAKRAVPDVPLAALMMAAMFPDLLTFVLQLAGIEHAGLTPGDPEYFGLDAYDNPISHSLLMDVMWAALFAILYFRWRFDARGAVTVAAAVLSHWLFDVVTHRPDMPLVPGLDLKVGLGLWNSIEATFAVEGGLWAFAIAVYVRGTQATARVGRICLWLLTASLTLWFVVTPLAPQPAGDFTTVGLMVFLAIHVFFVSLAYCVDRHRVLRHRNRNIRS